jgi:hypothetical protein
MTANQLTTHPAMMDDSARTMGLVAGNVHGLTKPIELPDLTGMPASGGIPVDHSADALLTAMHLPLPTAASTGPVSFQAAKDLHDAFALLQNGMLAGVGKHADAIDVMGKALNGIAGDYDKTAQGEKVGADQVTAALASVPKPAS